MSIARFGNTPQKPTNSDNPLTYCMADTLDRNFLHGSSAVNYGPRSKQCQAWMAERCAGKWDGYCEYYQQQQGDPYNGWPTSSIWPNTFMPSFYGNQVSTQSTGNQLLKNTALAKYCEFVGCSPCKQLFDPTNPNGAYYTTWTNDAGGGCIPVCRVDPKTINDDVVMNKILANPAVAADVVINICNTSRREGTDLKGTKLGAVCERYYQNLGQMK